MDIEIASYARRFALLVDTLRPYQSCWNQSVLQAWPSCAADLPESWFAAIRTLDQDQLYALDFAICTGQSREQEQSSLLPSSFLALIQGLEGLCEVPSPRTPSLAGGSNIKRMTAKKQHEIAAILPFIEELHRQNAFLSIVDVGGGVGHLARRVHFSTHLPTVSIDCDALLQAEGRLLYAEQKPAAWTSPLTFHTARLLPTAQADIDPLFEPQSLSMGLHTCGPLALDLMAKSHACSSLLNFACCYDRMDPERDYGRSQLAKEHPLALQRYAFFLATRGRCKTRAEFKRQERVNTYRFALGQFLQAEGLAVGFMSVGDANQAAYDGEFADYAANRFEALGLTSRYASQRAALFFQDPAIQRDMRDFFYVNIVRNIFSRPIEMLILFDRMALLEEVGWTVGLRQFFDPQLSPRNLGLVALRR